MKSPRFEPIMKSDTDFRVFDNLNNKWVKFSSDDGDYYSVKSADLAIEKAGKMNQYVTEKE